MRKTGIILLVMATALFGGCATSAGETTAEKTWDSRSAQRWNDPAATAIRFSPADLLWGHGKSHGEVNEIAKELAYNTNWNALVEFFREVPLPNPELRAKMLGVERSVGFGESSSELRDFPGRLSFFKTDLGGQIWVQASHHGWRAWRRVISVTADRNRVNENHPSFDNVKQNVGNERGAWQVLYLALLQAHGHRGLVDHTGEDWSRQQAHGYVGVKVLDFVGCADVAAVAYHLSNLKKLNWDGLGRETKTESWFRKQPAIWSAEKCNSFVSNWPEYTQAQINRFNNAEHVKDRLRPR